MSIRLAVRSDRFLDDHGRRRHAGRLSAVTFGVHDAGSSTFMPFHLLTLYLSTMAALLTCTYN
jgi:hypothetical protein